MPAGDPPEGEREGANRERNMGTADIGIFSMLRTRMQWHQERQKVLADNVANAETPNFRPHDLVELKFDSVGPTPPGAALARTNLGHQADLESDVSFTRTVSGFQIRPAGNAVNLEDEMMKVASNQTDFQTASMLYTKGLGLIKVAVGK
jgi:flagellar basal-body rod protein FlgB